MAYAIHVPICGNLCFGLLVSGLCPQSSLRWILIRLAFCPACAAQFVCASIPSSCVAWSQLIFDHSCRNLRFSSPCHLYSLQAILDSFSPSVQLLCVSNSVPLQYSATSQNFAPLQRQGMDKNSRARRSWASRLPLAITLPIKAICGLMPV